MDGKQRQPVGWAYVAFLCFVSILVAIGFSIAYTKHVQDQTKATDRAAKAAAAEQQKKSLTLTCTLVSKMEDFYRALDSQVAKDVAATWDAIGKFAHCP